MGDNQVMLVANYNHKFQMNTNKLVVGKQKKHFEIVFFVHHQLMYYHHHQQSTNAPSPSDNPNHGIRLFSLSSTKNGRQGAIQFKRRGNVDRKFPTISDDKGSRKHEQELIAIRGIRKMKTRGFSQVGPYTMLTLNFDKEKT